MIGVGDLLPVHLISQSKDALSVLCIRTSQPKYLVFGADTSSPLFVVQTGTSESLSRVFDITARLFHELPTCIPQPLDLSIRSDESAILVQRGLAGQPWFTLTEQINNASDWIRISNMSIQALERLHAASASQVAWTENSSLVSIFDDIRNQYVECKGAADTRLANLLDTQRARLVELDDIQLFHQHGDFCVNNLLFRKDDAGIIDFEHFGHVTLPLHDEFLLAGSLLALYPATIDHRIANDLWHDLMKCSRYRELLLENDIIDILFVLHLLWWIVEASASELRTYRASRYRAALQQILDTPSCMESWNPERTLL